MQNSSPPQIRAQIPISGPKYIPQLMKNMSISTKLPLSIRSLIYSFMTLKDLINKISLLCKKDR